MTDIPGENRAIFSPVWFPLAIVDGEGQPKKAGRSTRKDLIGQRITLKQHNPWVIVTQKSNVKPAN